MKEWGNLRFDVLQNVEKPSEFLLVEVYRTAADAAKHKETRHYLEWRLARRALAIGVQGDGGGDDGEA